MKNGVYINVKDGREVYFTAFMLQQLKGKMTDWLPADSRGFEKADEGTVLVVDNIPDEIKDIVVKKIEYNEGLDNPLFKMSLKEIKEQDLSETDLELLLADERKSVVIFAENEIKKRNADKEQ